MIDSIVLEEAVSLVEALVAKAHITSDKANTKILVVPSNIGTTNLIITVQDTIMYVVPMKNNSTEIFAAGSGVHMNGFGYFDANIMNELMSKYNLYSNIISTNLPLAQDNELRNNEEFENLLGLKSSQGLQYYHLPDLDHPGEVYLIPMFAGFLSLNKADTIGVQIFNYDEINHLLKFNIYKKKINRNIEMYCRLLKI